MSLRQADQKRIMQLSNRLAGIFYNEYPVLSSARNAAMLMLDIVPEIKKSFMQTTMGLAGIQPQLVRGH